MKSIEKFNPATESFSMKKCFIALANQKLNRKELNIINLLSNRRDDKNATQRVKELSSLMDCAESSVWSALRSLRSLGLITYEKRASSLALSKFAKIIAKEKRSNSQEEA
ncbi:hypothetical protein COU54_02930 [Candidatus Pacearchaeota archaeon CG10_big_fil_rev_8_21_14_0_10_31_24]|nr:MAG: hypothetical protein COU54_02930 [Candidatus Pacearchaeota archaeon CG10_big_fil_rev_8_21_14_0_10_31_24]